MTAKIINFSEHRNKAAERHRNLSGKLVWLYCPTCKDLKYTHVLAQNGRTHKCGTVVEEREVELFLNLEYTLSRFNLGNIQEKFESLPKKQKQKTNDMLESLALLEALELEFIDRLEKAAGGELKIIEDDISKIAEQLNAEKLTSNGLTFFRTPFRTEPEKRFSNK